MLPSQARSQPICLDYQATTPCAAEVLAAMAPWWNEHWGNPSSRQHRLGLTAAAAVSDARERLGRCLGVAPERIVFTSGATEANNLALLGHARAQARQRGRPGHLISVATEHHAVLDPLRQLEREGFQLTLLTPAADGLLPPPRLEAALRKDTQLVSVMAANNEIGVLQPMAALGRLCQERGISLHSDAAQAFGNIPFQPDALGIQLTSISAHKIYGPKGIGALVRPVALPIEPLLWGGGQEGGLRPGTLPVPLIVGFAAAAELALQGLEQRRQQLRRLRDRLWQGLQTALPDLICNGNQEQRLAHNLNITIPGVSGSRLHQQLRRRVLCSSGSACSSGEPSHVLMALGLSRQQAEASLRLSLGRSSTESEIDAAVAAIAATAASLRASGS
jgi:cysteine desulfurase